MLRGVNRQTKALRPAQGKQKQKQGGSAAEAASAPDRETMPNFGRTAQLGRLSPDKGAGLNVESAPFRLFASPQSLLKACAALLQD